MEQLWEEIRRRNLHRVTAAYAVVAWVLVQAAGLVFPAFGLPAWTLRLIIVLLIAALPILWAALWVGHPVAERHNPAPTRLHRTEWTLIAMLALVLIASAGEFAWSQLGGPDGAAPATRPTDASIAVLAFENMSDDPKNEFFSEGVSEELLNDLTQVRGLRVAGRTSSFSFRGKKVGIQEIGKTLHVRAVVEGSVRREGNRVRITAQLVNAADDYHIWSQTYDREIADIFAVQDEISRAITKELTGRLLGNGPAKQPVRAQIDPRAYTAFLKGRFFLNRRNRDAMESAIDSFKQAIALKPDYAEAHANLALTYVILVANEGQRSMLPLAQNEAAKALRLSPDGLDALLTNAAVQQTSWNWGEAYRAYRQLLARYSKNADVHHFYGNFFKDMHLPDGWLRQHKQAVKLDPLSPLDQENVAEALHALGRNEEAIGEYRKALALDPALVFTLAQLCVSYADDNMVDEAKKILSERLVAVDGEGNYATRCRAAIARKDADAEVALHALAQKAEQGHDAGKVGASMVGLIYAYAGDFGTAMKWFRKSVANREGKFFQNTIGAVLPPALATDARWKALMGGSDFQEWARVRAQMSGPTASQ